DMATAGTAGDAERVADTAAVPLAPTVAATVRASPGVRTWATITDSRPGGRPVGAAAAAGAPPRTRGRGGAAWAGQGGMNIRRRASRAGSGTLASERWVAPSVGPVSGRGVRVSAMAMVPPGRPGAPSTPFAPLRS